MLEDFDRTYIVTEVCYECESEIQMIWDTDERGYKAYCPVCGSKLMLCDECQHSEDYEGCDYCADTDSCFRNPPLSIDSSKNDTINYSF